MKKQHLIPALFLLLPGLLSGCEKESPCSHQLVTTVVREATCTDSGQLNHSCSLCGVTFTQTTPQTDHCFEETITREASCCEEGILTEMRRDIGAERGYHFSQLYFLAEGTYKDRKRKSKRAIAKALHLI